LTILSALPVKNDGKMSKIKERSNPKESERKTKKRKQIKHTNMKDNSQELAVNEKETKGKNKNY
jgi:hypothetical protein